VSELRCYGCAAKLVGEAACSDCMERAEDKYDLATIDLEISRARVAELVKERDEINTLLKLATCGRDAAEAEMTRARSEARNAEERLKVCKSARMHLEIERDAMWAVVSTAKVAIIGLRNNGVDHQILENLQRVIEKMKKVES
jgi:hypothetical protein